MPQPQGTPLPQPQTHSQAKQKTDLRRQLSAYLIDIRDAKTELKHVSEDLASKQVAYEKLETSFANLTNKISDLYAELSKSLERKNELDQAIEGQTAKFNEENTKQQRALLIISSKLATAKQELIDLNASMDLERRDMANRKIALDDREANLKRREQKATDKENMIQQNAALLDL